MSIQQNLNTLRHPVSNTPEKSPFNAGETLAQQHEKLIVLLLGSGGRECALAWKISLSPCLEKLYIAPGNGGTGAYGENVGISPLDFKAIADFAAEKKVDMVVVGNEDPLVAGIFDYFEGKEGAPVVVGPSKAGAALEGSKDFAKQFMVRHSIPTARYQSFTAETVEEGCKFLETLKAPYVLKADGLAAGKGVLIIDSLDEAKSSLREMLGGMFGKSSATVVIEEFLKGIECSVFVLTDGNGGYRILPVAKDYKRIGEGDTGPNTGGMGAYSPAPILPDSELERMTDLTIRPILREMARQGHPYTGVLYAGLMITEDGPKVLEYNVRFGDPECQPLLMRLESNLLEVMTACARGKLEGVRLAVRPEAALGVVVAAEGYPGSYARGLPIAGLEEAESLPGVKVFQAGTRLENGQPVSSGGRVLCVTALGADLAGARDQAYAAVERVRMPQSRHRTDIGAKGLRRLGR